MMTLNQALAIIKEQKRGGRARTHFLVCGCQPLHLATFLHAHLLERFPDSPVEILTGLYGNFPGNLAKAAESPAMAATVALEWSDLDPRLGLRSSGGWSSRCQSDILATCRQRFLQVERAMRELAARMPLAVGPPSLPLPPIGNTVCAQSSVVELELDQQLASFLLQLSGIPGIRILQPSHLRQLASGVSRLDAKMEFVAGFPYSISYASLLARSWVDVLYPQPAKKGLITDLDDTLWSGLVGEIGVDAISWDQEHHAQIHGLYQQMLGHLADSGVLLGVCSKNEAAVVQAALGRKDLFLNADAFFPVRVGWGPKSAAVAEIVHAWNIGEDMVVFVDDTPMELSEVQRAFPGMACLEFPKINPAGIWDFLNRLRDLFGKPFITEEDNLRMTSLRAAARMRETEPQPDSPEFLRSLNGVVTLDYRKRAEDGRALELINKTNQFNLNGVRMSEREWRDCLEHRQSIVVVVSYQDKFGPLGRIATLVGTQLGKCLRVTHWVMSCRAFSRQLEYHVLDSLFRQSNAEEIEFAFQSTERNQPLQEFFRQIAVEQNGSGEFCLPRAQFLSRLEKLPHQASELLG